MKAIKNAQLGFQAKDVGAVRKKLKINKKTIATFQQGFQIF